MNRIGATIMTILSALLGMLAALAAPVVAAPTSAAPASQPRRLRTSTTRTG